MFLSNKNNIKEVLLFPAMKPTDEQMAVLAKNAPKRDVIVNTAMDMSQFSDADMTSEESLKALDAALAGKSFVHGTAPSKDDATLLDKVLQADATLVATLANVAAWTKLLSMFTPEVRASW